MPKRAVRPVEPELDAHNAAKPETKPEPIGTSRPRRRPASDGLTPEALTFDPDNANLGTARGDEMLEASLRDYGPGRSGLADRRGTMLAGNKTLARVRALGIPVRVIDSDGSEFIVVRRTDLDLNVEGDTRAREMATADNRASEVNLLWDPEALQTLREDGLLDKFFRADELAALFDEGQPPDGEFREYDETVAGDVKMITCPHCGTEFPR